MQFSYEDYFNSQKRRFFLLFGDDRQAIAGRFMSEELAKLKELKDAGRLTPKEAAESQKYLEKMMIRFIQTGDIDQK